MQQPILTHLGKDTGNQATLDSSVFGITPHEHSVYLDVKRYLAHQRQGTHKTKEKGEVTASTRKLFRQKGTGNARAGSLKSGIRRGGGRIFGPQPRNYHLKINKKVKILARKSVLSQKAQEKKIIILKDFTLKNPQTKAYKNILKKHNLENNKTLLITNGPDANLVKATKNLPQASVAMAQHINTYTLLSAHTLLLTEGALQAIHQQYSK